MPEGARFLSARAFVLSSDLRIRQEYFGSILWRPGEPGMFRLGLEHTKIALLHLFPRDANLETSDLGSGAESLSVIVRLRDELIREGVLVEAREASIRQLMKADILAVQDYLTSTQPTQQILKPFWVHIQPFRFCNQRCTHCYCDASPDQARLQLSVEQWISIVDLLDDFGVREIYLTGGETLLVDEFFQIATEIRRRRLGFGISTNAMVLTPRMLREIERLRISPVQVSLDGATSATHDRIRGVRGAFGRTLAGINKLQSVASVVINTVVETENFGDLEEIVKIGLQAGCKSFKFFPLKLTGRAAFDARRALTDDQISSLLIPECRRLAAEHRVEIETVDLASRCGSASSGFAVDEFGNAYPCIFGVRDPGQSCGNLLATSVEEIWFRSETMRAFRSDARGICHRCERRSA